MPKLVVVSALMVPPVIVGLVKVAVPMVGEVPSTFAPEPVEVVTPVPPLATGKVPVTPVVKGKPVPLVSVTEVGVPRTGVTSVGLVDKTLLPVPVEVVTPVPPLATGKVPVTPVVNGRPVALVKVTEVGVPNVGEVSVGLVANTKEPEPVSSVTADAKLAEDGVAKNVATFAPSPEMPEETGRPEQLVSVPEAGVPKTGAVKVGEVSVGPLDSTTEPVPVEVVVPVPPEVTAKAVPRLSAAMWFVATTTSVPLFTKDIFLPTGTDTPV